MNEDPKEVVWLYGRRDNDVLPGVVIKEDGKYYIKAAHLLNIDRQLSKLSMLMDISRSIMAEIDLDNCFYHFDEIMDRYGVEKIKTIGDAVNTASRMESSGSVGAINISGDTYALVKDFFACEYRGKVPAPEFIQKLRAISV